MKLFLYSCYFCERCQISDTRKHDVFSKSSATPTSFQVRPRQKGRYKYPQEQVAILEWTIFLLQPLQGGLQANYEFKLCTLFQEFGRAGGRWGEREGIRFVGWWEWFLGNNTWQQLHLEDLKVNSTKAHLCFLQGRVTYFMNLFMTMKYYWKRTSQC